MELPQNIAYALAFPIQKAMHHLKLFAFRRRCVSIAGQPSSFPTLVFQQRVAQPLETNPTCDAAQGTGDLIAILHLGKGVKLVPTKRSLCLRFHNCLAQRRILHQEPVQPPA